MLALIAAMAFSPDAKSFVLRQLVKTGLFNATMEENVDEYTTKGPFDFNFTDENGPLQNTSSLRGKVVFINFWASWCPPCRAEFPSIDQLYSQFKDNPKVYFLTINLDRELETGKAYLAKEKYSVPLFTAQGYVPKDIYTGALPTTVVLDKTGQIRYHHTGFANYASPRFIGQLEALLSE